MGHRRPCRCCRSAGHETYDSSVQNAEARYLPPFLAHIILDRFYCNRRYTALISVARISSKEQSLWRMAYGTGPERD
jgi:hypothetical protein